MFSVNGQTLGTLGLNLLSPFRKLLWKNLWAGTTSFFAHPHPSHRETAGQTILPGARILAHNGPKTLDTVRALDGNASPRRKRVDMDFSPTCRSQRRRVL